MSASLHVGRLANGLEYALVPTAAPSVALNLWVRVGSADEAPGRTGFAHLFEHLMFQGSARVKPGEHMAAIEAVGGTVNATTSADRTNYFETVPPGALELALWLEADRLASLAITEENFEAQRAVVQEEKRERYDNQPYGDLLELLLGQHFSPDHPYGHLTIGSMSDLEAATLGDVDEFFARWYRPAHTRLVLAGAVDPDTTPALLERHLGSLPPSSPAPARTAVDHGLLPPGELTVARPVPYPVSYLSWKWPPASDPAHPALDLCLGILTDGHASVLHRDLVQHRHLAQEVHATLLTHHDAPSISMLMARPADGVDPHAMAEGTLTALERFLEVGPTDEQYRRARAQAERTILWQRATTTDLADATNEAWHVWGDPSKLDRALDELHSLELADVHAAARRWLEPDDAHRLHYLTRSR